LPRKERKASKKTEYLSRVKKSCGKAATSDRMEKGNLLSKDHSEHEWEQATLHFIEEIILLCLA